MLKNIEQPEDHSENINDASIDNAGYAYDRSYYIFVGILTGVAYSFVFSYSAAQILYASDIFKTTPYPTLRIICDGFEVVTTIIIWLIWRRRNKIFMMTWFVSALIVFAVVTCLDVVLWPLGMLDEYSMKQFGVAH